MFFGDKVIATFSIVIAIQYLMENAILLLMYKIRI